MLVPVGGMVGPQMNKFEQVSSDDHQMSVEGGGVGPLFPVMTTRYVSRRGVGPISGFRWGAGRG